MVVPTCSHPIFKNIGTNRNGSHRFRCKLCGHSWTEAQHKPLGDMRIDLETAKLALRLLVEGNSVRSTERLTGMHRDTICKLLVYVRRCLPEVPQCSHARPDADAFAV